MPPDLSTTTPSRVDLPPAPPPAAPERPENTAQNTNDSRPTGRGDPAVGRQQNAPGNGRRQQLLNFVRGRTRNATTAAAAQSPAETAGENAPAASPANDQAAHTATQLATTSAGGPPDGTEPPAEPAPTSADAQKAAEDAQKLQEQIELSRKNSRSSLDGLSDSSRDDLMKQLGGNRNWEHEGIRQADKLAEEMAKQSERWGKI